MKAIIAISCFVFFTVLFTGHAWFSTMPTSERPGAFGMDGFGIGLRIGHVVLASLIIWIVSGFIQIVRNNGDRASVFAPTGLGLIAHGAITIIVGQMIVQGTTKELNFGGALWWLPGSACVVIGAFCQLVRGGRGGHG